jgi:hypothetical protein
MGPFLDPAPGRSLRVTDTFALSAELGHTWMAVERVRLREDELPQAIAEVDAFMHESGTERASWWLTERSTPPEDAFLAAGLELVESDYLFAAMVLTREPPAVEGIEVRRIATFEEYAESRRLALEAFAEQHEREPTAEQLEAEWAVQTDPAFAAWLDGRMASVGRAIYTRVGGYLMGGSTAAWARPRRVPGGRAGTLERGGAPRHTGARRRRRSDVATDPRAARLRAGPRVPSARVRTLRFVTKEICPRCSAAMEWRHGTFQCPKCRYKVGCCEGETGDCRDPG